MSGIESGRVAPATVVARNVASAIHSPRPKSDSRPASQTPPGTSPGSVARVANPRGATNAPTAIGFLAQAIAQESLLLGARATKPPQKDPVALYRQTQGDAPRAPGPQIGIDIKI